MTGTESRDQFTLITTLMLVIPVDAVNCSRPYSCGVLILQEIVPLCELESGHRRLNLEVNLPTQDITGTKKSIRLWH